MGILICPAVLLSHGGTNHGRGCRFLANSDRELVKESFSGADSVDGSLLSLAWDGGHPFLLQNKVKEKIMVQANLLIVENEGVVAGKIKRRLEESGYIVCAVAHDGETALAAVAELQPDLVLIDIGLKGEMDGVETAGQIRERFSLPVVYLSTGTDPETPERGQHGERFGFVAKPFETRSLIVAIERALNRYHRESERIYKEKLQAVLETAGAICHELNQPMMAISGLSELLLYTMDPGDPAYERISKIISQVHRMSAITQKLMGITRYETKPYTTGERIVDIEKSCMATG